MKRYKVIYMNHLSQTTRHTTYALGEFDLNATLVDLVNEGNFIDWVGEKDENNTIGNYYEISKVGILKELNILEMNDANENAAYKEWEY